MKKRRLIGVTLALLIMQFSVFAQEKVTIEEIFDNPGQFENEEVVITGIVNQYFQSDTKTTSYYIVQGDYGGVINVNSSLKSPVIYKKYKIKGVVVIDQVLGRPVIIEKSRTIMLGWIFYALGGIVIVLLALLVVFIVRSLRSRSISPRQESELPEDADKNDYATIRIKSGPPPTMKIIPGKLEIITGLDKGKSFGIVGYPTSDGNILTIGRDPAKGDKKYAHIQLMEPTVSHKQAEIIYKGNTLSIKNLSTTNNTQVDGKILEEHESTELKPGMVIKTGEVEFKYIL